MNQIFAPPPNYAWLQSNGYCNPGSYGASGTVCWTYTATATQVDFNSGWSSTGCATMSFGNFELYTCAAACALVGTGLSFTGLTVGQCYTWCMSWSGNGGGCDMIDLCPYYQETVILAMELQSFTANKEFDHVRLSWETASEHQAGYFEIERSADGEQFSSIGDASASGQSSTLQRYMFIDPQPEYGTNYYRLRSFDENGEQELSDVTVVHYNTLSEIEIYPNPTTGLFHILSAQSGHVTVVDLAGRVVLERKQATEVDLSGHPAGFYFVHIATPEGSVVRRIALK